MRIQSAAEGIGGGRARSREVHVPDPHGAARQRGRRGGRGSPAARSNSVPIPDLLCIDNVKTFR